MPATPHIPTYPLHLIGDKDIVWKYIFRNPWMVETCFVMNFMLYAELSGILEHARGPIFPQLDSEGLALKAENRVGTNKHARARAHTHTHTCPPLHERAPTHAHVFTPVYHCPTGHTSSRPDTRASVGHKRPEPGELHSESGPSHVTAYVRRARTVGGNHMRAPYSP